MGVSIDITERKQSEEVRQRHSATGHCHLTMDAIISLNLDGDQHIVVLTLRRKMIYGCSDSEAIGRPLIVLSRNVPGRRSEDIDAIANG